MYVQDSNFFSTFVEWLEKAQEDFYVSRGTYLKKKKNLYPKGSHKKLLIKEAQ